MCKVIMKRFETVGKKLSKDSYNDVKLLYDNTNKYFYQVSVS